MTEQKNSTSIRPICRTLVPHWNVMRFAKFGDVVRKLNHLESKWKKKFHREKIDVFSSRLKWLSIEAQGIEAISFLRVRHIIDTITYLT